MSERSIKQEIIDIGKRIHQRGWISATDGNLSAKLGDDRLITTPTGVHKGYLEMDDFVITDMQGKVLSGNSKPSSELSMHLTCYRQRPEINAVIHAHPTYCIAFSVAGIDLAKCLLPEVIFTLGSIPTAQYAPPTTDEVPKSIEGPIKDYDAIILERHGSVTVGDSLGDAYNKLERMEHVAEITYHARQLGGAEPLSRGQVDELVGIRKGLGLPDRKVADNCNDCNACNRFSGCKSAVGNEKNIETGANQPVASVIPNASAELVELITREVRAELSAISGK